MPQLSFAQYATQVQDPRIAGMVDIITNESIFIPMLEFEETGDSFAYQYDRRQTLGGIAFRGLNQTYTPDTGVVNPVVESLRIFGGSVSTDRQLAKGASGKSTRAGNVAAKTKKAALFFDANVIKGDSEVNALQFDGLRKRLVGNQVISMGANGGQLTLKMIDKALDAVYGPHSKKRLIMNTAERTFTKQLILSSAGGAGVADFKNGELDSYNGAKIEVLDESGDETAIIDFDETQGNNATTASIYVVRPGTMPKEGFKGLVRRPDGSEPIEYADYGERNGVYDELVEAVMGIALHHPRSASRLKGISVPA